MIARIDHVLKGRLKPTKNRQWEDGMRRALVLAGGAVFLALLPVTAFAQATCPEGRTASGACVNSMLADSMRQISIITSQPLISYTHYPVLPSLDLIVRYPNQLNPNPLQPSAAGMPLPRTSRGRNP